MPNAKLRGTQETLCIRRTGIFTHYTVGGGKCGIEDNAHYSYKVEILVKGTLRGPKFFILENGLIHDYFLRAFPENAAGYIPKNRKRIPGKSCELMAQQSVHGLWRKVSRLKWTVLKVRVEISGNQGVAWLVCERERKEERNGNTSSDRSRRTKG